MDITFTTLGALIGLVIAIVLIIRQVHPAYSLILGALVGGLIGGGGLEGTVSTMVSGAGSMMSSVLRILTSGILAGALIKTGSAEKIADTIVTKLGEKRAVAAISIATMIICAVGVFIDISVITVAPIALSIGKKTNLSKPGVLLAMIGGGKAGNIISPNPNTIAASEAFGVDLTSLMMKNIIPAVCALIVTIVIAGLLAKTKNGEMIADSDAETSGQKELPGLFAAILGPLVVIILLEVVVINILFLSFIIIRILSIFAILLTLFISKEDRCSNSLGLLFRENGFNPKAFGNFQDFESVIDFFLIKATRLMQAILGKGSSGDVKAALYDILDTL